MLIKQDKWYKLRNNTIVGPIKRINDTVYDFWCPAANFRCWKAGGSCRESGWLESGFDIVEQVPEHRTEDFTKVYKALKSEFDDHFLAPIVCGMIHLNCEKKIEDRHVLKHLIKDGSFTSELLEEFNSAFYVIRTKWPDTYKTALDCWRVYYDWQCRQALHGLGGCEKKTFKELIGNLNNKRLDD